jgi:beta-lactam-binding protein with PASTA domain/predicted Ser/Thr protein kinase
MRELAGGTLIDRRYRVISRIGSGGMADVYCCEDLQLGRQVAVKLLHERFAEDEEFVERFRREASSAASLSHPNIVGVFDRGEWDGTYYIAMEYLEGRSLKALIRAEGPLPPSRAIELTMQVLGAARSAHQRGVIHRDLKPHNVIVDAEGRVKVTDFGIARAGVSEITETGSIMGTVEYLSPEQAQGHAVGPRSDLYSIGVVLYELLTARLPFSGDSAVTIALKQISELPVPPSAYNRAVSAELDAIVLAALAKDPEHRYQDADAFLAALDAERERLRWPASDRTAEFAAPVAAAHEQPVSEAGSWDAPAPAPAPSTEIASGPGGRRVAWPWIAAAVLGVVVVVLVLVLASSPAAKVVVPKVVGATEASALSVLQRAGFDPVPSLVTTKSPTGIVIGQSPTFGTRAKKGSIVQITVSEGPGTATVPNVVGDGRLAAKAALTKAGLLPIETMLPSASVALNHVISTNPAARTAVPAGSSVAVDISSGPQQAAVPNVIGKLQAAAQTLLTESGFNSTVTSTQSTEPAGTVLTQSPTVGTDRPLQSVVALTVAKAPKTLTLQSLVGESADEASSALGASGLKASTTTQSVTDPAQDGQVVSQSPSAGSKVAVGDTVTLVIGKLGQTTTTTTTPTTTTTTPTTTTTTPTTPVP